QVPDDVVLDGQPGRGRDARGRVDVRAVQADAARQKWVVAVDRESVDDDLCRRDVENDAMGEVVDGGYDDGLGTARAGVGVDAGVGTQQGQRLVDRDVL